MWWNFFNEQCVITLSENVLRVTKKDIIRDCDQITLGSMKGITAEEVFIIREEVESLDL